MEAGLCSLPNIGAVLASELEAAGIKTPEQLRKVGSKQACARLRESGAHVCLSKLYALEGAVRGVRWHVLAAELKADLAQFLDNQP